MSEWNVMNIAVPRSAGLRYDAQPCSFVSFVFKGNGKGMLDGDDNLGLERKAVSAYSVMQCISDPQSALGERFRIELDLDWTYFSPRMSGEAALN